MMKTGVVEIRSAFRAAVVPVAVFVKARRRTERTLAGQAVLAMLHAWNTAGACAAHKHLKVAAGDSELYASSATVLVDVTKPLPKLDVLF